jgi:hypothetical protein
LDSESGSDKDDAKDEANVAVGLVATIASEAEPETDSEDEDVVYSKIPKSELIESLKELLSHFEYISNELKDLKEKFVDLLKQQEKTLLDLKESEKELDGYDFIFTTNASLCKEFSKLMQDKFEMSMMGELKFFLGIQINQCKDGVYVH